MHVLHRPHLPRLISVSIAAAVLAIVISLALAASINPSSEPSITGVFARQSAPAPTSVVPTHTPRWASRPFTSLLSQPLPAPWLTARP
ncbi:MAG: hypothetical protein M3022_14330 [Actinomycetota bacterium]|nr:hypothetical protein [Actinomycetota bacterium]